jgi:hypothetical protein
MCIKQSDNKGGEVQLQTPPSKVSDFRRVLPAQSCAKELFKRPNLLKRRTKISLQVQRHAFMLITQNLRMLYICRRNKQLYVS